MNTLICMTSESRIYVPVTDDEAVNAFEYLAKTEIIPGNRIGACSYSRDEDCTAMDPNKIIDYDFRQR